MGEEGEGVGEAPHPFSSLGQFRGDRDISGGQRKQRFAKNLDDRRRIDRSDMRNFIHFFF